MADRYLLESGAPDGYLLEDSSGVLLLESAPLQLVCGAECGLSWDEGEGQDWSHWADRNGTVTIGTTTPHSGTNYFSITGPSIDLRFQQLGLTDTCAYVQFWFRLSDATPASNAYIFRVENSASDLIVRVTPAGVLELGFNGATFQSGPTLSASTWYGIEFEQDVSPSTVVARWRTYSGGAWTGRTDATRAGGAQTYAAGFTMGTDSTWGAGDVVDYDDIRIGSGTIVGQHWGSAARTYDQTGILRPDSDGTHDFVANDFTKTGSGVSDTDTTLYQAVDEADMTSTADYIAQVVARTGAYIEINFDSASETDIGQVSWIATGNIASAGSGEHHLRVSDDGSTWVNLLGDWRADGNTFTTTSVRSRSDVLSLAPSSVPWTQALLNSLRVQWGNSDYVTPAPRLHNLAFEYEYAASAAPPVDGTAASTFLFSTASEGWHSITGTSDATFLFSTATTAVEDIPGTAASTFLFSTASEGWHSITGTSDATFLFSHSADGTHTEAVTGTAASTFLFSTATTAVEDIPGVAASTFLFSTATTAVEDIPGVAASTFLFSTATTAIEDIPGVSAATFVFSHSATGNQNEDAVSGTGDATFHFLLRLNCEESGFDPEGYDPGGFWGCDGINGYVDFPAAGTAASTFPFSHSASGWHSVTGTAASSFPMLHSAEGYTNVTGSGNSTFVFAQEALGNTDAVFIGDALSYGRISYRRYPWYSRGLQSGGGGRSRR